MTTPREQLANTLRQSRIDAGYGSHAAPARKLNVSRPVVSKAENARQPVPSDAVLAAWAGGHGRRAGRADRPCTAREVSPTLPSGWPSWCQHVWSAGR